MRVADSNELRVLVGSVLSASEYARWFNGADVDAGDYNDDREFIRIIVHFENLNALSESDVDTITSSIEGAIAKKDDRFPSVRFSEP